MLEPQHISIYSLLCFKVYSLIQSILFLSEGTARTFCSALPIKKKALLSAQTTFNLKCKQVSICFANVKQVKVESNQKYHYLKSTRYRPIL